MLVNCGVGEDSWESLGLQGDPTSPFWRRSVFSVHWKEWCEAETPILWPPDAKSWLIGKDPDARKDWRQEEKGMTEDEMVGWHHWLNGHEFGWTPGVGDGQEGLVCCSSLGHKESDMTEQLNWTELRDLNLGNFYNIFLFFFLWTYVFYFIHLEVFFWQGNHRFHETDKMKVFRWAKPVNILYLMYGFINKKIAPLFFFFSSHFICGFILSG